MTIVRYISGIAFPLLLAFSSCVFSKSFDVVLLHGLANKHHWSSSFISELTSRWGANRVFLVYTNTSTKIYKKSFGGKTVTLIGPNDYSAGKKSIADQAKIFKDKIALLQKHHGLDSKFNIIAHSMGGLVSRRYIHENPNKVVSLVTLGTPNHGSHLADDYNWAGYFIGASAAIKDLRPSFVKKFNSKYPAAGAPLANGGRIYTVRGDCDGWDCWGWGGELALGWETLRWLHWDDNDGLVPNNAVKISGAVHLADYWSYDHLDLVRKSSVARKAASVLK